MGSILSQISKATGLPPRPIREELTRLLLKAGRDPDHATLEDIRDILATYLQEVLLEVKESLE